MKRRLLLLFWGLSFLLALGSGAIFIQGLMRDYYTGDPVVRFDPGRKTGWIASSFRVWGQGSYALRISSVNHNPDFVGRLLESEFEVMITDPEEKTVLRKTYRPGSIEHRVPSNYGDTLLETLELNDWPNRSWRLQVRVTKGDPDFVTSQTQLKLRKQRYDPGMGGLLNYAMLVPAGLFLVVAIILSSLLAAGGTFTPLVLTAVASSAFLFILV